MLHYYVEFMGIIAGVYTAMFFDQFLKTKIWTNGFFATFSEQVQEMSFGSNQSLASQIIDQNQVFAARLQDELTKKSVYMFALVVLLLIGSGIERTIPIDGLQMCALQASSSLMLLISFIVVNILFSRVVYKSWCWIVFSIILDVVIAISAYYYFLYNFNTICIDSLVRLLPIVLVCSLLLPILRQVFICWVYRSIYPSYVCLRLTNIRDEYESALDCVEKGTADKMPQAYKDLMHNKFSHNQDKKVREVFEDSKDEYANILMQKVTDECCKISALKILWQTFVNSVFFKRRDNNKKVITDSEVVKEDVVSSYGYNALYDEYLQEKAKKPSYNMAKFCQSKKIDKGKFLDYINKHVGK